MRLSPRGRRGLITARRLALLGACLLWPAGCGREADPAPYAEALREKLAVRAEMVEVLEGVRDEGSMKAARAPLRNVHQKERQIEGRLKALPPPSAGLKEQLSEEFGERLQANLRALQEQVRRIRELPGGEAFLQEQGLGP